MREMPTSPPSRVPLEAWVALVTLALVLHGAPSFAGGPKGTRDAGVDKRREVELLSPTELREQAKRAKEEKKYARAIDLLEQCVELEPKSAECHVMLGSALAASVRRTLDPVVTARARAEYERFLELADPADPRVPQVKQIIAVADELAPPAKFELAVGAKRRIYRMGLMRAASSNPAVLKVEARDDDLFLTGVAPGKAKANAWLYNNTREAWTVTVVP
jgi:hypothetical protein